MRAQIIAIAFILFVALIIAGLGLGLKREQDKIEKTWSWLKFKK